MNICLFIFFLLFLVKIKQPNAFIFPKCCKVIKNTSCDRQTIQMPRNEANSNCFYRNMWMNCNSKKKASGKHLPDRIIALLSDSNYIRSLIKKKSTTHHILLLNTVTVYVIYVKNLFLFFLIFRRSQRTRRQNRYGDK